MYDDVLTRISRGYRPDTAEGLLHMSGGVSILENDQRSEGEFLNVMLAAKVYVWIKKPRPMEKACIGRGSGILNQAKKTSKAKLRDGYIPHNWLDPDFSREYSKMGAFSKLGK
jgi:hypothetical protein